MEVESIISNNCLSCHALHKHPPNNHPSHNPPIHPTHHLPITTLEHPIHKRQHRNAVYKTTSRFAVEVSIYK